MIGIGSTLNQRFALDKELGRGGMGAVYRATDQVLQRSVAIKVLKEAEGEEVGKKIRLEAQISARLLHDNVVRLYDFGEAEGVYFLVMEEVDGTSFARRWRRLSLAERLRVAAQVADALDYAHRQGVIHRDVKPANVLMTAADQAKLSDFGLSMMAGEKEETRTVRGTPQYMSPEQARGKPLDHRTDLYSLGVMLYECATGALPFQGQAMALLGHHVNSAPKPPRGANPDVSPALEALILSLLAKDPEDRPVSGDAVARSLREEVERQRRSAADSATVDLTPGQASGASGEAQGLDPAVRAAAQTTPDPAGPPTGAAAAPAPAATAKVASPLARAMLEEVLAEPVMLSADERYLCGHYLGYLLGGSRRQGIFLRRPHDPRNADRARLLLAMTWLLRAGPGEANANVARAAALLDERPDVRPALNPVVVMKYLANRDTPQKRKRFRVARKQLQDASPYAQKNLTDANGVLNPGLMPGNLDDLRRIAPARDEVDDQLVSRWNRVSEVWRENADFRAAVLAYATRDAEHDPASADLWPEVVYPLMERARWQRTFRPRHEAVWDYLSAKVLHVPDAGVRLDRIISRVVPVQVAAEIDEELVGFVDEPRIDDEPPAAGERGGDRLTANLGSGVGMQDLAADPDPSDRGLVALNPPDPYRFTQGELRDLWNQAMATIGKPGKPGAGNRSVPVGPYRLAVIPSVRGRSAGQVVLQGMPNKQIELLTPSIRAGGSGGKPVVAVWIYQDASAAVAHLDFKGLEKFILWHAPNAQQFNFDDAGELNHMLFTLGMEVPDQLDRVLSKKFRPTARE